MVLNLMKNEELRMKNGMRMFFVRCSLFILCFLTTSLFAEPLKPEQYAKPEAQDSVYKTPWGIDPAARETDAGRWVLPTAK